MREDHEALESSAVASIVSTVVIPARLPASLLSKEAVLTATEGLYLDDLDTYLRKYTGSELMILCELWGFKMDSTASKSQLVSQLSSFLSMYHVNNKMAKRWGNTKVKEG